MAIPTPSPTASAAAAAILAGLRKPAAADEFSPIDPAPDPDTASRFGAGSVWPDMGLSPLVALAPAARPFSMVFPEDWAALDSVRFPEFDMPDFRGLELDCVPEEAAYIGQPELVYRFALAYTMRLPTHIVGPPGTGKTNGVAPFVFARLGVPYHIVGLSDPDLIAEQLFGGPELADGATVKPPGLLTRYLRGISATALDEFARASGAVQQACMGLMESPGRLFVPQLDINELIHPGAFVFATDNAKGLGDEADRMVGTSQIDAAVLDRFVCTLEVDYMPVKAQQALIHKWCDRKEAPFPDEQAHKLAQFARLVQQAYKAGQLPLTCSPRAVRAIAQLACMYRAMAPAVRTVLSDKFAEEADQACIADCYRTAFGADL